MHKWGSGDTLFEDFLDFLILLFFLLKLSIFKFLTLFILLIHSFYTNNINFLNILRKVCTLTPIFTYYTNIT